MLLAEKHSYVLLQPILTILVHTNHKPKERQQTVLLLHAWIRKSHNLKLNILSGVSDYLLKSLQCFSFSTVTCGGKILPPSFFFQDGMSHNSFRCFVLWLTSITKGAKGFPQHSLLSLYFGKTPTKINRHFAGVMSKEWGEQHKIRSISS